MSPPVSRKREWDPAALRVRNNLRRLWEATCAEDLACHQRAVASSGVGREESTT